MPTLLKSTLARPQPTVPHPIIPTWISFIRYSKVYVSAESKTLMTPSIPRSYGVKGIRYTVQGSGHDMIPRSLSFSVPRTLHPNLAVKYKKTPESSSVLFLVPSTKWPPRIVQCACHQLRTRRRPLIAWRVRSSFSTKANRT